MSFVNNAIAPIRRFGIKTGLKFKRYSPEICLGVGLVGFGVTIAMACKATLNANEVLNKFNADKAAIEEKRATVNETGEAVYDVQVLDKELSKTRRELIFSLAKQIVPCALAGGVSTAFVLKSYGIMKVRNTTLLGAYTALEGGFKAYRERVAERFGEDVEEEIRSGVRKVTGLVTEVDENGKEVTEEKEVYSVSDKIPDGEFSDYAVIFNEFTSRQYQKNDPMGNEMILLQTQHYFNQKLIADGYVVLADVYQALGIERTAKSMLVGWIKDSEDGDGYISFGPMVCCYRESGDHVDTTGRIMKTLSGKEWILDFNVDGLIIDKMDQINRR